MNRVALPLLLLAAAVPAGGCGSGGGAEPPRPGVSATLDADNRAVVHDELYACLRKALPGALLASYLGGQASISDAYNRASFDPRLAAPKAEAALLDSGGAEYIGVRANRRTAAGAGCRSGTCWSCRPPPTPSARRPRSPRKAPAPPRTASSCGWSSGRAEATGHARRKPR